MTPLVYITAVLRFLQLEQYDVVRFVRSLKRLRAGAQAARGGITWTPKLLLVVGLAGLLELLCVAFVMQMSLYLGLVALVVLLYATPFFLVCSVVLLLPLDWAIKTVIIFRARRVLLCYPQLKIVGITGSYGKTTMKEMVGGILSEKFRVLKTPDNINTPLGVARLITTTLNAKIDVFVVEMGAYQKGDIQALCRLVPPDIAVLTGINESHLERFGSIENTIEAKFEIVQYAKPHVAVVANADDTSVSKNLERFVGGRHVLRYGEHEPSEYKNIPLPNFLAAYAPATFAGAAAVAGLLGLSKEEILRAAGVLAPAPHRLVPHEVAGGVLVIDDSYNGNPAGVRAALEVLGRFKNRRKLYLTPGLVEMGERSHDIHVAIGKELAAVADIVLLIETRSTQAIAKGLESAHFPKEKVLWYKDAPAAHKALPALLQPGDVILFQNDWTEQYA